LQVPQLRLENWAAYDETASGRYFWTKFDPEGLAELYIGDGGETYTKQQIQEREDARERKQFRDSYQNPNAKYIYAATAGVALLPVILASLPEDAVAAGLVAAQRALIAYNTNPAVKGAVTGTVVAAVTYAETKDPQAAVTNGLLTGADTYASTPKSAQRTTAEAAIEVQNAQANQKAIDKSATAAMRVRNQDGSEVTNVASSRARLTPAQRQALMPGEQEVKGRNGECAEVKLFNHAIRNGQEPLELDASRRFCPECGYLNDFFKVPTKTETRPAFRIAPAPSEPSS
jgi:hypothetical protein